MQITENKNKGITLSRARAEPAQHEPTALLSSTWSGRFWFAKRSPPSRRLEAAGTEDEDALSGARETRSLL
jgi:hypothetical protein